jgi:hypothetical protein
MDEFIRSLDLLARLQDLEQRLEVVEAERDLCGAGEGSTGPLSHTA